MTKLPLGVAESLSWLSATPEELALLSSLRGIFPSDFEATFKAVTGSLEQDHDFFFAAVADKLRKLFKSDGLISPEEMKKVGEGAHPFYSNGGTNQRERLALLLEDLISGEAAPERLHLKWEELLKLAEGDPFKAFILAEFERPQVEE